MSEVKLQKMDVLSPLPDLFRMDDGRRVATEQDWEARRAELYRTVVDLQYGGMPPEPEFLEVEPLFCGKFASYRIHTGRRDKPITFAMQIIWPKEKAEKYPVIIDGDGCFMVVHKPETLDPISEAGVAFIRFNRAELAHDISEDPRNHGLYAVYPEYKFGALAAWAWGYHRCLDAAIRLGIVDERIVACTGQSRGGKTALLAGATDSRFTIVNPNCSGCSGAGCYRVHAIVQREDGYDWPSEKLEDILKWFPHWFGEDLSAYLGKEGELPFDQHYLKALVAPRILLDTEAMSDAWANPAGTYLTYLAAMEAYRFLGAEENNLIHFRDGFHQHAIADIEVLLNVIRYVRDGEALAERINRPPFPDLEPIHNWSCPQKP